MAYIGKSPTGAGVRSRFHFTATGGETSLSGADDNSKTLVFADGEYVDVYLNGVLLFDGDYNTTTANTIGGLDALTASDVVEIVVYDIFSVADTVSAKNGGTFNGDVTVNGDLTVDTDTLRVDSTNNRVGIGTSSPSYPFHVSSSSGNINALLESTGSSASRLYFKNTGMTNAGDTQVWSQNNDLAINTNGSEKMRIGTNGVIIKNQELDNLHIQSSGGTGYTQGDIRISSGTTDNPANRGQGVYLFNEGNDRTWYMGTLYGQGTDFGIATYSGSTIQPETADRDNSQITIKTNGKTFLGPVYTNPNTDGNKIFGMRAPNILSWEDEFSTTNGAAIGTPKNWYNIQFNKLQAANNWYHSMTPFGGIGVVWRGTANTGQANAQGGFDTTAFTIDPNYSYVFINFVQRISSETTGNYYFGCGGSSVINTSNSAVNTNPYFSVVSGIGNLTKDEWYVDYRTVRSKNDSGTAAIKNNGLYRMRDGSRLKGSSTSTGTSFKWKSDATTTTFRTYLYYANANNGSSLQWYQPMVFKCDGTEPTLSEVFKLYEVSS